MLKVICIKHVCVTRFNYNSFFSLQLEHSCHFSKRNLTFLFLFLMSCTVQKYILYDCVKKLIDQLESSYLWFFFFFLNYFQTNLLFLFFFLPIKILESTILARLIYKIITKSLQIKTKIDKQQCSFNSYSCINYAKSIVVQYFYLG